MKIIYEMPQGNNNHLGVTSTSIYNTHLFNYENEKEIQSCIMTK